MEKKKFQMPHTYIIIFGVILVAALLTCFIPLGKYDTKEITYTVVVVKLFCNTCG